MTLVGRNWFAGSENYRFGFNGKEQDDETYGNNNALDFGERVYDLRLGRMLSIDRKVKKYPSTSPYAIALNNPIVNIDRNGNDVFGYTDFLAPFKYGATAAISIMNTSKIFTDNVINAFSNSDSRNPNKIDIVFTAQPDLKDPATNLSVDGMTGVFVKTKSGGTVDLGEYVDNKDVDTDDIAGFEIHVVVNPNTSSENQAVTILHETSLHALQQKALLDDYYKSGDLAALQKSYKDRIEGVVNTHIDVATYSGLYAQITEQIAIELPKKAILNVDYGYEAANNNDGSGGKIFKEETNSTQQNGFKGNNSGFLNSVINQFIYHVKSDITNYDVTNSVVGPEYQMKNK